MRPVPISSTAWCKLEYSSFPFYTYPREKKSISLLHVNNKSKEKLLHSTNDKLSRKSSRDIKRSAYALTAMTSHEGKENIHQFIQYANTSCDNGEMPIITFLPSKSINSSCKLEQLKQNYLSTISTAVPPFIKLQFI